MWAPNGDEAFDAGSRVLQFDIGGRVRLIAYTELPKDGDYCHDPNTIRDVWLSSDRFYAILSEWLAAFDSEWHSAPKAEG